MIRKFKKLEFEPKPQKEEFHSLRNKAKEPQKDHEDLSDGFSLEKNPNENFDIFKNSFVLNLPVFLQSNSSLVILEDDSIGIKKEGKIYKCDIIKISDGVAVEIDKDVKELEKIEYMITAYDDIKTI